MVELGIKGLTPESLADASLLVEKLEEEIVLGYLHPRERLIEEQLAVRFEAKRHVVRDALIELSRIGLVDRHPNRGASVVDLKPTDVEQIYYMREMLEANAIGLMPLPISHKVLAPLVRIQERHDAATRAGDARSMFRINIEFHREMFSYCGNRYLCDAIEQFGQKSHGVRSLAITQAGYNRRAGEDHWKIIKAFKSSDREKLLKLSRAHIGASRDAYIAAYRSRFGDS